MECEGERLRKHWIKAIGRCSKREHSDIRAKHLGAYQQSRGGDVFMAQQNGGIWEGGGSVDSIAIRGAQGVSGSVFLRRA